MGDEWDMDFPRNWTWEYQVQQYATSIDRIRLHMGFTDKIVKVNDKIYHEFTHLKEVHYSSTDFNDSTVNLNPMPDSRYIRQDGNQIFILCSKNNDFTISTSVSDPSLFNENQLGDILLYDFSKEEGDKQKFCAFAGDISSSEVFTISDVETFSINGRDCKSYRLHEISSNQGSLYSKYFNIIETIGLTYGGTLAEYRLCDFNSIGGGMLDSWASDVVLLRVYDESGNCVFMHPYFHELTESRINTVVYYESSDRYYYNLQGQQVTAPVKGELYILRDSHGARKIVF